MTPVTLRAQSDESLYRPLGVGFHVGVGGMMPTGSLSDDFKGLVLFGAGINVDYNRARAKIDFSFGQPSFKNQNLYAVYDEQGRDLQLNATANPTLFGISFQLGYTVLKFGRLSVTPTVGVTSSNLSWDINYIKYEKDEDGIEKPVINDVTASHENKFSWTASVVFSRLRR